MDNFVPGHLIMYSLVDRPNGAILSNLFSSNLSPHVVAILSSKDRKAQVDASIRWWRCDTMQWEGKPRQEAAGKGLY